MKKLDTKGSVLVVLLIVAAVAVAAAIGYYVWDKNQNKPAAVTTETTQETTPSTSSSVVTIPGNFTSDPDKAAALRPAGASDSVTYDYYVDIDTATIITVKTRPIIDSKDLGNASLNANAEASTFSKAEFPSATKLSAETVDVKGTNAAGYLVTINNTATNVYASYIGAANKNKIVLITVRSPEAYKTQQQAVVQSLISSIQL